MTTYFTYENNKTKSKELVVVELASAIEVSTEYILTGNMNEFLKWSRRSLQSLELLVQLICKR